MLLSVLIPSYNHERFVLSTLEAASRIDIREKEIIVIDDGSSDGSVAAIRDYIASKDLGEMIHLISRENRGLVKTLNEGLSLARGKYFYGVASDDIPIPEGVCSLVKHLEKNPSQQFVLGNAFVMESEDKRELPRTYGDEHRRFFAMPFHERQKEMFLHYPQPILLQATVFRTAALKAIGGWREDIVSDDFSLFLRLFSELKDVGKDFAFQPEIVACIYRRHELNVSRNVERQFLTIEETLTKLCPPEWRNAAYVLNCAGHGLVAIKSAKVTVAVRIFHSTIAKTGPIGLFRAVTAALIARLTNSELRLRN
jgi:cellulose synthase/poly-beta-1,6-N-acetylglucosamine synthase-like glycosyltransferase